MNYESWGRFPQVEHNIIQPVLWPSSVPQLDCIDGFVLPFGMGRSYGDVCLNDGNTLIPTRQMRRFIEFDKEEGIFRCEAGVSLEEVLDIIVPHGWFLPVSPGTKYVTIGGAIANDIHGKNHHVRGTFGCHVRQFELVRSSGEHFLCSREKNPNFFAATIGGLGLTGLIVWAEFELISIPGPGILMDRIRFGSLDEFFSLSAESERSCEYTVAWIDCFAGLTNLGRGIFIRGQATASENRLRRSRKVTVPFDFPAILLNPINMKLFNKAYYSFRRDKSLDRLVHFESFFYPLDGISSWNRLYGKRGLLQYQCVVPLDDAIFTVRELLLRISRAGQGSFLGVLKIFGDIQSPGILSFPRPGVTLALDFPVGPAVFELLDELDSIVREVNGAGYPCKDARMSSESFRQFYPNWAQFSEHVDPKFSSSFWRRVDPTRF